MNIEWHDIVGGLGVITLLATYLALQLNRISAQSLSYSVLNGLGAGLILISLTQSFNLSAVLIESAWLIISIVGAIVTLRNRGKSATSSDPIEPPD
ncbi:MAG: hypothetical protein AB8G99_23415 [Planctomycetaceae bacterium]